MSKQSEAARKAAIEAHATFGSGPNPVTVPDLGRLSQAELIVLRDRIQAAHDRSGDHPPTQQTHAARLKDINRTLSASA